MDGLEIREATPDDVTDVAAMLHREIAETRATWTLGFQRFTDMRGWFSTRRSAGYPLLVAAGSGRLHGWGALWPFREGEGFRRTTEHSVWVAEASRRRGVGRALLSALVERARDRGGRAMIAAVDADNAATLRMHAALGFGEAGRLVEVGEMRGERLDLVLMQRLI